MTTDPNNPLNIADEDIGKEGRFLVGETPAVLIGLAHDENGIVDYGAFKLAYDTGCEGFYTCRLADSAITRPPTCSSKSPGAMRSRRLCALRS